MSNLVGLGTYVQRECVWVCVATLPPAGLSVEPQQHVREIKKVQIPIRSVPSCARSSPPLAPSACDDERHQAATNLQSLLNLLQLAALPWPPTGQELLQRSALHKLRNTVVFISFICCNKSKWMSFTRENLIRSWLHELNTNKGLN